MNRPDERSSTDPPVRRLRRAERREQILTAATRAFSRVGGFTATSLDDVASEAGVTRMVLYRHFESKPDLYEAVIDRAVRRLHDATVRSGALGEASVPGMLAWAAQDPEGFRLLFHYAARETDFRASIDELYANMAAALRPHLAEDAASEAWANWGAHLATSVAVEAIMTWLDAGQPDPEQAPRRVLQAIEGVYQAVRAD